MKTIYKNLKIYCKTTKTYELKFTSIETGIAISIDNWTIYYTVKENKEDSDANAKIKKEITSHSDPDSGIVLIPLSVSDTDLIPKSYYYSIDYKDDSTPANEGVLFEGRVTFKKKVRNTIT